MIHLHRLRLQNFIVYENLIWDMQQHPLAIIRGKNLDRRSRSSNAVGKSLLAASIANLITESPPIAVRKRAAKDLVYNKAHITLDLHNDKVAWSLHQFAKGRTVNYDIWRNGKSLEAKSIDTARQFIHQAVPFSEDHLYSQFYISSYRPSVLLIGAPNRRMSYFESVFDLRIYDLMRKAFLAELKDANSKFSQQQLLQRQREELAPQLAQDLTPRISQIRRRYRDLLTNYRQTNREAQNLTAYVTLAEQLASTATRDELITQQRRVQIKLRQLRRRYRRAQRQLGAAQQSRKIWRTRRKLQRQLDNLPPLRLLSPNSELRRLQPRIAQLETRVEQYLRYEPHLVKYHEIINQVAEISITPNKVQQQLTELTYRLRQRRRLQGGKKCPVCGSRIDHTAHRHTLRRWGQQKTQLQQQLLWAKQAEFCRKLEAKLPGKIIHLPLRRVQRHLDNYRRREQQLQRAVELINQRKSLRQQLRQLPRSKQVTPIRRQLIRRLEKQISQQEGQEQRLINDLRLLDKLAELDLPYDNLREAKLALRAVQTTISQLSPRLQKISDRMHRFVAQQSEYNAAHKQLQQIEQDLSEIDQVVENREMLLALAEAYSTKGIKIMQIGALADAYTTGLNTLASAIYSEPYKFHTEVSSNTFNIVAERKAGISDVRSLSGSESRQFLAISALALISLMPDNLRCSHLILDEMEVGVDPRDMHLFTSEFVPLLCSTIPHVVLITPQSPDSVFVPGAKELLLVRKNGKTHWGN